MNPALLHQANEARGYTLKSVEALTLAQLLAIPVYASNNILWNIGHVVTDQCTMLYEASGLPHPLGPRCLAWFAPGTSPRDWKESPNIDEVLENAREIGLQFAADYEAGRFNSFVPHTLEDGVYLSSIDDAVAHCTIHEAIHLGVILMLRKAV